MSQRNCERCGVANPPGTQFCENCDLYLGWGTGSSTLAGVTLTSSHPLPAAPQPDPDPLPRPEPAQRRPPAPDATRHITPAAQARPTSAAARVSPSSAAPQARPSSAVAPTVEVITRTVTMDPDAGASVDLRILNPSPIVDGYRVVPVQPPPWLTVQHAEIRLLPNTEEVVSVRLGFRPQMLVFVQRIHLRLEVVSQAEPGKSATVEVIVTVPPKGGPVTMRVEPTLVRLRDSTSGAFTIHLDNRGSNYPQRYELSGSDDEGVVRFTFDPAIVDIGPGRIMKVAVRFDAPAPGHGQQANRRLTVKAANDQATVEGAVSIVAESSEAPIKTATVELDPAHVRARDQHAARTSVVVHNRRGTRPLRVRLVGDDPENAVRFTFSPQVLDVRPGTSARADVLLSAELPARGSETVRNIEVSAHDGAESITATGIFTQSASSAAIATAQLTLEPEQVRIQDQPYARVRLVVDNTRASVPLRASLHGTDPERAVRFTFTPPVVDVPARSQARVTVDVQTQLPPLGQVVERQIKISARDQYGNVETTGVLVAATSDSPIRTAELSLDPQQIVTQNQRNGQCHVVVDNRRGARPLVVRLGGRDPERQVHFDFRPDVVEVAPGQVAWSLLTVSAERPPSGQRLVRQLQVTADDGSGTVNATGAFVQSTTQIRPLLRIMLSLTGFLLVLIGAFLPWVANQTASSARPTPDNIRNAVDLIQVIPAPSNYGEFVSSGLIVATQPFQRVAVVVVAALMVLGLTGATGTLTRMTGLVVAATMVALAGYIAIEYDANPGIGAFVVVLGGLVGFAGGLCVKR